MITITMNSTDYDNLMSDRRRARELTQALGSLHRLSLIHQDIEAGIEVKSLKAAKTLINNFIRESITAQLKANPDYIRSLVVTGEYPVVYDTLYKKFHHQAWVNDQNCVDLSIDEDYIRLLEKIAEQVEEESLKKLEEMLEEEDSLIITEVGIDELMDNVTVEELKEEF